MSLESFTGTILQWPTTDPLMLSWLETKTNEQGGLGQVDSNFSNLQTRNIFLEYLNKLTLKSAIYELKH